jgi:adenosylcobinamide kinase/adenosylcobinamide-phosphate guanylyltransferase
VLELKNTIILVIGGARSGKSKFAAELAGELGERVTYIATAEASDPEMTERIDKHRAARPVSWNTIEAPFNLVEVLSKSLSSDVVIIDCLTVFLNNLLLKELGPVGETENPTIHPRLEDIIETEIKALVQTARTIPGFVIIVSNEVGMGLAPPYHLGRFFRDIAGRANRLVAEAADKVYWVNCGMAIELKALAKSAEQIADELK